MARKRGGLAGIWDRNKQFIKPVATLAAGALTGGAGGAVVGGLMGGLDRPGKGGIGFDVGKGAMGAAQGYAMGKSAQGLKGLFTSSAAPSAASSAASPAAPSISGSMPAASITPGGAGPLTQSMATMAKAQTSDTGGRMKILKDLFSPQGIGGVAKGTLGAIQSEREMGLKRQQMEQSQQQFDRTSKLSESRFAEEQRLANLNEERRRKMAQLMAMFAPGALQGMQRPPMEQG